MLGIIIFPLFRDRPEDKSPSFRLSSSDRPGLLVFLLSDFRSDGDVPVLIVSACACSMMIRFLDIVVFNPPLQTVYINLSVHGGFSGNSVLKNGL